MKPLTTRLILLLMLCWSSSMVGCAKPAKPYSLTVRTEPPGAQVYLKKYGQKHVHISIAGIGGGRAAMEGFEEPFMPLGITPVTHHYWPRHKEASAGVVGEGRGSIIRTYTHGVIRIEQDGQEPIERSIPLNVREQELNL